LEVRDFERGFSEKGNIVMLSFEGSKMVGRRGVACINHNAIYWWEKNYKDLREVLPEVAEERDKDKDKDK
jgi:hypothetical protein